MTLRGTAAGGGTAATFASEETSRVAWFNCATAGIAGDMALGALVDAGADRDELGRLLDRLPVGGWSLDFEAVLRGGLAATRAVVRTRDEGVVRTYMHIVGVIEEARLPSRARDRALSAFSALAEAEGRLHRRPTSQVHFHEVGELDAIVDIVGCACALELFAVTEVAASAVAQGTGVVRGSHGLLPNPSPAAVELLSGVPVLGRDVNSELTTPTGAAMLRAWSSGFGAMPDLVVEAAGYGAGSRELDGAPNCTQVVIGTSQAAKAGIAAAGNRLGRPLVQLEANLDDATGETLAAAVAELMSSGALDAWITPAVMKKGRPAHVIAVLCEPALVGQLTDVLTAATGTLGVRASRVERLEVERSVEEVDLDGEVIRVKVSPGRVKAEHSDLVAAAARTGVPVIELAARAEALYRTRAGRPAPTPLAGPDDLTTGPAGKDDPAGEGPDAGFSPPRPGA